jgi:3',5'-nucleoside bisphosphate phosphatase
MKRPLLFSLVVLLGLSSPPLFAAAAAVRYEISFPNLPGYETLHCDFHTHTVFSDGLVWPTVRIGEAWRQGLDAISITDHIEYQPHKEYVPTNHARPYELAAGAAQLSKVLLVRGAEITRDTPPGHFNAIFLKDIAPLDTEDLLEAIGRACGQGAFVFWNHQGWKGAENGRWLDVHTQMYEKGWLRGMEVCNGDEYYPDAHRWCLEKKLTMLAGSDIHDADLRKRSAPDDHRTMTLLFAKEKTLDSLKEALQQGRTLVWYQNQLIGREELLKPFFHACLQLAAPHVRGKNYVAFEVRNVSGVDIQMALTGKIGPSQLTFPAGTTSVVRLTTSTPNESKELQYAVTNFLIAPQTGLPVTLQIAGP